MRIATDDVLPIALRAYAVPRTNNADEPTLDAALEEDGATSNPTRRKASGPPTHRRSAGAGETLIFDTETRLDPAQRLMVGMWRFYRADPHPSPKRQPADPLGVLIEEGFFYPDDLPDTDPDGYQILQDFAESRGSAAAPGFGPRLLVKPLSWWLKRRLYRYGCRHGCAVVGFNLPFDLGRLAKHWGAAEGFYHGGWSLRLWDRIDADGNPQDKRFYPRLRMRSIDPRRTLFGWAPLPKEDRIYIPPARFVDLRTLTFALTDRDFTLEKACTAFGDPFEKADVEYGVISPDLLAYGLDDVAHTTTLYRNCLAELAKHGGVELEPHSLYSPASVGEAYLKAMGVAEPRTQFGDLDPQLLGWSMCAFYGGRAEARVVRVPVPVVIVDVTSMYPAQNALLGTWPLITADQITTTRVDEAVRELVNDPNLNERLLDPATWRDDIGVTLVELDHIDGLRLPVRAPYEQPPRSGEDQDTSPTKGDYGIGVNPLHYDGTLWCVLPEVLAARLLGDTVPQIKRAIRLHGVGLQASLRPVRLRGGDQLDPTASTNPFVKMIELRHRVRRDPSIDPVEKNRLDQFLKITANAAAYGSLARFDRRGHANPVPVTVYGPGDDPFETTTANPETPGPYTFPPVAASITAGARLILAMMEQRLTTMGGGYAFMDTDSVAIIATPTGGPLDLPTAPGQQVRALSYDEVRALLREFASLDPYSADVQNDDPTLGRSPWKVEHDSLNQPLMCYAIASKRYVLYRPTDQGHELVAAVERHEEAGQDDEPLADGGELSTEDWSEHGLGMYLDPSNPDKPPRDRQGRRIWMRQAWDWILTRATGQEPPALPDWAQRPALTRFTLSGPRQTAWFRGRDERVTTDERMRPGSFGLLGQVNPIMPPTGLLPAAPYERDPTRWSVLDWYDRATGGPITVTAATPDQQPTEFTETIAAGAVPLRTLASVLATHGQRPEHKSLGPDGGPATGTVKGLLQPRPIQSGRPLTRLIGKEGNKLLERATGETTDTDEYRNTYTDPATNPWPSLVLPVLRDIREALGTKHIAREVGVSDRQVRNWFSSDEPEVPHAGSSRNRQRAEKLAVSWCEEQLRAAGHRPPADPYATLYAYLLAFGA